MKETSLKTSMQSGNDQNVMRLADIEQISVRRLLSAYGLSLQIVARNSDIPGSYWGDEEAGLIGQQLLARHDTPLHSILHETCHYICMDKCRRAGMHTNAGGDYDEENAVCYLQILLADQIRQFGRQRMFEDMDEWGYTFRLGSAQAWFDHDAQEAHGYLLTHGLIDTHDQPTFRLRDT